MRAHEGSSPRDETDPHDGEGSPWRSERRRHGSRVRRSANEGSWRWFRARGASFDAIPVSLIQRQTFGAGSASSTARDGMHALEPRSPRSARIPRDGRPRAARSESGKPSRRPEGPRLPALFVDLAWASERVARMRARLQKVRFLVDALARVPDDGDRRGGGMARRGAALRSARRRPGAALGPLADATPRASRRSRFATSRRRSTKPNAARETSVRRGSRGSSRSSRCPSARSSSARSPARFARGASAAS